MKAPFFIIPQPLDRVQVPEILKIRDGHLELIQLMLLAGHEHVQKLPTELVSHDPGLAQLPQGNPQVIHQ